MAKVCKNCGRSKPAAAFYRDAKSADRLRYECKACTNALTTARLRANPEAARAARKRWEATHPDVIKALRATPMARALARAKQRRWYARNREKSIASASARAKRNAEKIREQRRARYAADEAHRLRVNAYNAGRQKFGKSGTLTPEQWREVWESYRGLCAYCAAPATSMDHVVPRKAGGLHEVGNVVPACKSCNSSKRSRSLLRFLLTRGILAQAA